MPDVRFFTRDGCHLCSDALVIVERELAAALGAPRLAFSPCSCGPTSVVRRVEYQDGSVLSVIDVDAEPDLKTSMGPKVPVVEVAGGRSFMFDVDAGEFRQAVHATVGGG